MSILGIDEVGRGPWAGPLVIGACILPKDKAGNYPDWVNPLTDSKKLSKKKREEYAEIISNHALATGLGWVSAAEIDELGLSESLRLATRRAVEEIKQAKVPFTEIVIDGTVNFLSDTSLENYVTILKKADLLIKEVSAASIIAKVARDRYMEELAEKYPDYGFEKHVGYGTKLHLEMLNKLGPCPEHRHSFGPVANAKGSGHNAQTTICPVASGETASFLAASAGYDRGRASATPATAGWRDLRPTERTVDRKRATSRELGNIGEEIVAKHLVSLGHRIIARNHKTKFYEIDIVSIKDDRIYFTEVKYRKDKYRGTPLDMITKKKLKQMTFAGEAFLKYYQEYQDYSPLLAVGLVSGDDFRIEDWLVLK